MNHKLWVKVYSKVENTIYVVVFHSNVIYMQCYGQFKQETDIDKSRQLYRQNKLGLFFTIIKPLSVKLS